MTNKARSITMLLYTIIFHFHLTDWCCVARQFTVIWQISL